MTSNQNKTVLITGASSGIGKETALLLDKSGYKVIATVRREEDKQKLLDLASQNLQVILLDLENTKQIKDLSSNLEALLGQNGLFALVNNAGYNYVAPFEYTDENLSRKMMETNFFGAVYLAQNMIPYLRKFSQKTGLKSRILNISSIGGAIGLPWESYYHASKFALLGISESMRFELYPQNINVCAVMPGGIRTPFFDKTDLAAQNALSSLPKEGREIYEKEMLRMSKAVKNVYALTTPVEIAAERIARILAQKNPQFRHLIGLDARLIFTLTRILPAWIRYPLLQRLFS